VENGGVQRPGRFLVAQLDDARLRHIELPSQRLYPGFIQLGRRWHAVEGRILFLEGLFLGRRALNQYAFARAATASMQPIPTPSIIFSNTWFRFVKPLASVAVNGRLLSPQGASPETASSAAQASRLSAASQIAALRSRRTASSTWHSALR
jgi:hypothetical protein